MFRLAVVLALVACNTGTTKDSPPLGSGSETGSAPAPPPIDAPAVASDAAVDAAVVHLFEQWKAGQFAEIRDGSHPELKHTLRIDTLQRMHDTMADAAGDFVKAEPPFTHATDPNGDVVVTGNAVYAKGTLTFKLTMRSGAGTPLLTDFNLALPKELQVTANPADAEKVARAMLDGLVHGKIKTELVDPGALVNLGPPAARDAKLKAVLTKLGTLKSIGPPLQAGCSAAQCIRYELVGSKSTDVAVFEVGFKVRHWLVRSFTIGDPVKPPTDRSPRPATPD
jgi:hypothetical protein